jgi:hypothetical protein
MMAEPVLGHDLLDLPDTPLDDQLTYWQNQALTRAMTIRRYKALLQQWVNSPIFSLSTRDCFVPDGEVVKETMRALQEPE